MIEIISGIEIRDLAIYLKEENILIISDTHIGYEEALNKEGFLIPRFQFKEIISRLKKIFLHIKPVLVIINGDIKHEFGKISEQEWRDTLKLLDFLIDRGKKVMMIRGNHDIILNPIARKRNVEIADNFLVGDTYITHGDKIPKNDMFKNAKNIIIGHEHPCISVREDLRTERFKCFLKGKWKNKTLIVQPSFNLVTEGTDVTRETLLSPFLKQNLKNFEVFIVEKDAYYFGKIKNIN